MSKSSRHAYKHEHNPKLHIGAHASITPTILSGLEFMTGLGANAMQIFAGPSQSSSLKAKQRVSPEQAITIKSFISRTNTKLIIHAIYTLNLCSHPATSGRIKYAQDNIIYDMELAERIGAQGVVIHLGSAIHSQPSQAISNLISNIQHILDTTSKTAPHVFLALETPAGQGKQVATMLDELADVWSQLSKSNPVTSVPRMNDRRLGICIDTAHIFSAGVDIRTPAIFLDYIKRFDKLIGTQHIKCFHLNDSKAGLNSRRDIHEGLGDGYIFSAKHNPAYKLKTIRHLLRLAKLHSIPVILETHSASSPDKPNSVLYAQEIAKLWDLALSKSRSSWQLIHPASSQKRRASNLYKYNSKTKKLNKSSQLTNNFIIQPANIALITKLVQLQDYYTKIKQDKFRALAYGKAVMALRAYPAQIVSASQVSLLANIGPSILEKIKEYLDTGDMAIFKAEDIPAKLAKHNTEQSSNIINILGFGPARTRQLARQGIKNITQLQHALDKGNLTLTQQEQLGFKYHNDLAKPIPRAEAEKIFKSIQQVLKTSGILQQYDLSLELAGSYPSGKESSKDIDVLIFTSKYPDPDKPLPAEIMRDIATVCTGLLSQCNGTGVPRNSRSPGVGLEFNVNGSSLKASGSLLDIISQGSGKILGITQLTPGTSPARHIDIRLLPSGAQVFGRFYFTSGRVFNQMVRAYAKKQGYKLNEFGLYDLRKKTPARVPGLDSEEAIMAHIGLAFIPMSKRR